MERILYTEETVSEFPSSPHLFEKFQELRDELAAMEAERDMLLSLVREVADADGTEDMDEVLVRVKEIAEGNPYPEEY